MSALYQRERSGQSQYVEVGMLDCIFPTLASPVVAWTNGHEATRTGNQHSGLVTASYNVYEVEDGHVAGIRLAERHWTALCELRASPDLADDERFATKARRAQQIGEVDAVVREFVAGWEANAICCSSSSATAGRTTAGRRL